jgi:hypothetical protein
MPALKRTAPLLALVGLGFAVPALAQQADLVKPGEAIPAACTDADVTPERNRRASDLYKTGKIAAENLEREKAIFYYVDAYRADCTGHAVLLKVAELWELKGNKAEALRYTQAFLDRAKPDDPNRESATVRRDRLKRDVAAAAAASATVTTTATTTATTQPTATSTAPTATTTATTAPTSTTPPRQQSHTILPWVATGVGGAAAIVGGVFFVIGAGQVSDAEASCPGHSSCTGAATDKGNSGRHNETLGVIVGAAGLAVAAGGLIWHFAEGTGPKETTGVRVTPHVAPGYGGVSIGGRF